MRVHIVSHSHWDREWYQTFDQHRMKLVELFDDLLELFEKDEEFRHFHLDGQTIALDDYLEIRPYKREALKKVIEQGKLIVGPYYMLQDELLLTGEENVRNALVGKSYEKEWGKYMPKIGYFPDTFGHIGQLAQICAKSGWKYAFIGRGVKPIGFDNQVLKDESFVSQYSEMWLEAPDGSRVLAILFANWYSNGNEIPVEENAAKAFWDSRLAAAKKYASTDSLLMMNGCDHQPVQKDLSAALHTARRLYPEIEFVHSTLEEYAKEVEAKLPQDLAVISGEMTSQETDGWYTLANTASSRIELKEANIRIADKLTTLAEPLSYLLKENMPYPQDELTYAWKTLLQNLPHDSICGCSIDQVHREMLTRYQKAEDTVDYIIARSFEVFKKQVKTDDLPEGTIPFLVLNPAPNAKEEVIKGIYPVKKHYFRDSKLWPDKLFDEVESLPHAEYALYRANGEKVNAKVTFKECLFGYELPNHAFRQPYISENYEIEFLLESPAQSWECFYLKEEKSVAKAVLKEKLRFENDFYSLEMKNKQLVYLDKKSGRFSAQLIAFEDTGDIGNEYIYFAPQNDQPIDSRLVSAKVLTEEEFCSSWELVYQLIIPEQAEELLQREQKGLVEFKERKAGRSKEMTELNVTVKLDLWQASRTIRTKISFENKQRNHRLRLLVDGMCPQANTHFADSSFEIVTRPNGVSSYWKNPNNPQHLLKMVGFKEEDFMLAVSASGLQEYEITNKNQIGLTLLRSTEELGDWGYFPTVDSLGLRKHEMAVDIVTYPAEAEWTEIGKCLSKGVASLTSIMPRQEGRRTGSGYLNALPVENGIFYTSLKKMEEAAAYVVRYVNLSKESKDFAVEKEPQYLNLLEEPIQEPKTMPAFSIRTEKLK
ncbi:alpha-mannosidase [Clostridiales bacterium COT073_COT-073]|nr:alpha-mannosidase [Clostridiales bacterium COT073_COT-073]